jgi:regulator of replication initiation timing
VFSSRLATVQTEYASTLQLLESQIGSLELRTEHRVKFIEAQSTWADYDTMRVVPNRLKVNIEDVLKEMSKLKSKLQELEQEKTLLQDRFEALKERSKMDTTTRMEPRCMLAWLNEVTACQRNEEMGREVNGLGDTTMMDRWTYTQHRYEQEISGSVLASWPPDLYSSSEE